MRMTHCIWTLWSHAADSTSKVSTASHRQHMNRTQFIILYWPRLAFFLCVSEGLSFCSFLSFIIKCLCLSHRHLHQNNAATTWCQIWIYFSFGDSGSTIFCADFYIHSSYMSAQSFLIFGAFFVIYLFILLSPLLWAQGTPSLCKW